MDLIWTYAAFKLVKLSFKFASHANLTVDSVPRWLTGVSISITAKKQRQTDRTTVRHRHHGEWQWSCWSEVSNATRADCTGNRHGGFPDTSRARGHEVWCQNRHPCCDVTSDNRRRVSGFSDGATPGGPRTGAACCSIFFFFFFFCHFSFPSCQAKWIVSWALNVLLDIAGKSIRFTVSD